MDVLFLLLLSHVSLAVPTPAAYDYTIDCASFSRPAGWKAPSTCALEGNWSDIINRPLPAWYADMKFGIFIHWGVFSVPSFGSEWYWHNTECGANHGGAVRAFQDRVYGKNISYPDFFGPRFRAELFNATEWASIIKDSGATYVLPVAKHHDGFVMWNTSTSPGWNAVDVGPKRDVLGELYEATQSAGIDWGIYYSQGEWFDSMMVNDSRNNFTTDDFVKTKVEKQRRELVEKFPKAILWHTDGGWFAPDAYWGNLAWLRWLYGESPMKDRVVSCNSLGFNCCANYAGRCWEYGDAPSGGDRTTAGTVVPHYYTNQMTIQRGSWSWDRSEEDLASFFSTPELLESLASTAAWNGTLVLNIRPTADGKIPPIFTERLADMGAWMRTGNGAAIHGTRPWKGGLPHGKESAPDGGDNGAALAAAEKGQQDGREAQTINVYYTATPDGRTVFGIFFGWPSDGVLRLKLPVVRGSRNSRNSRNSSSSSSSSSSRASSTTTTTTVHLLGTDGNDLKWTAGTGGQGINIDLGGVAPPQATKFAWVVELSGLEADY